MKSSTTTRRLPFAVLAALLLALAPAGARAQDEEAGEPGAPPRETVTISIIHTTDLHGQLEPVVRRGKTVGGIEWMGGYIDAMRADNPEGSILVDAGDLFQGTLLSNQFEGAPVIAAYNALGYDAVALGNHEFDFGPVGPALEGDDPRGALEARMREASFPFLAANLFDAERGRRARMPNLKAYHIVERRGVKVGIVGLITTETPLTGSPRYLGGLEFRPLAETAARWAKRLREREGCQAVVVVAHAGGQSRGGSIEGEVSELAQALPEGAVDAIIGGHMHIGATATVNGIPISLAFSKSIAVGRLDLEVDLEQGRVVGHDLPKPERVRHPDEDGTPPRYKGEEVKPRADLREVLAPFREQIDALTAQVLGNAPEGLRRRGRGASLGALITDAMRAAVPEADAAILNPFSIRADVDEGPVTFGDVFGVFPIDNTIFRMDLTGRDLREALEHGVSGEVGIVEVSGLKLRFDPDAEAGSRLVSVERADGTPIGDEDTVTVVVSDFMAPGGDGFEALTRGTNRADTGVLIRDALVRHVRALSGLEEGAEVEDPEALPPIEVDARGRVGRGTRPARPESPGLDDALRRTGTDD